jgi:hypothetical protein
MQDNEPKDTSSLRKDYSVKEKVSRIKNYVVAISNSRFTLNRIIIVRIE